MRITNRIGIPIERGFDLLPASWAETVGSASRDALSTALRFAMGTLDNAPAAEPSNRLHKLLATASGTAGGAFGLPALAVELPLSTTLMLRSIADIARTHGEDLGSAESKLACLEVFALGGRSPEDDASESAYFAVRIAMSRTVSEAAKHIAGRGVVTESAPAIMRLLSQIGSRFGIAVSEKVAAQAVPVIGAVGGGVINWVFMDHFQDMAKGHFIVRRLERQHGADPVRVAYEMRSQ